MKLNNFITRLKSIDDKAHFQLINIVNSNRRLIEDANRERLADGKLTDENDISYIPPRKSPPDGVYSRFHSEARKKRGKQVDKVDLNFKGKFYRSIKYQKTKDGGKIISTDSKKKNDDIDRYYGDKVLGLTEDELQNVADGAAIELANLIANKISS